jgi:preprotein translocase subunit YajC
LPAAWCFMLDVFDPFSVLLLAQQGAAQPGDGGPGLFLTNPLTLIIVLGFMFYLLVLRPESRRRAEMQKLLQNIKKNDEVVTVGGIYGVVVNAPQDSEFIWLRLDESTNTRVKVLRSSISRVLNAEVEAEKAKAKSGDKEKSEVKERT